MSLAVVSIVLLSACGADEPAADTTAPGSASTVDGVWRALSATVDGAEVVGLDTVFVTMEIAGGRASGSSGCNQYEMDVAVVDGVLTFGPRTATEAFCSAAPGEIEAQFASMTGGSPTWSIDGDRLTLTTPAAVWVFERLGTTVATTSVTSTVTSTTTAPTTAPVVPDLTGGLDGPVMYAGPDAAVAVADTVAGTLFLGDNCLVLMRDDQVTFVLVVWPNGTRWEPDGTAVVLPSGERLEFGPVIELDGVVIDDAELAAYANGPAVRDEIDRCRRTEPTQLFVAA